jgi:DNA-binding Lrp family transcriptional regulator
LYVEKQTGDIERVMETLYSEENVTAIINLKVDTKEVDEIAREISKHDIVEDVFLVTGDTDVVVKARFSNYQHFKDFMVHTVSRLGSVKDSKTLMVVSTYKDKGQVREPKEQ